MMEGAGALAPARRHRLAYAPSCTAGGVARLAVCGAAYGPSSAWKAVTASAQVPLASFDHAEPPKARYPGGGRRSRPRPIRKARRR